MIVNTVEDQLIGLDRSLVDIKINSHHILMVELTGFVVKHVKKISKRPTVIDLCSHLEMDQERSQMNIHVKGGLEFLGSYTIETVKHACLF